MIFIALSLNDTLINYWLAVSLTDKKMVLAFLHGKRYSDTKARIGEEEEEDPAAVGTVAKVMTQFRRGMIFR